MGRVLHVDGTCNWKAPFPYLLIVIVLIARELQSFTLRWTFVRTQNADLLNERKTKYYLGTPLAIEASQHVCGSMRISSFFCLSDSLFLKVSIFHFVSLTLILSISQTVRGSMNTWEWQRNLSCLTCSVKFSSSDNK